MPRHRDPVHARGPAPVPALEPVAPVSEEKVTDEAVAPLPVAGLLRSGTPAVHRSLAVGAAHDPAEAEADAVADRTVRALGGQAGVRPSRSRASAPVVPSTIGADGGDLGASASASVLAARGRGSTLPDAVRRQLEPAMGVDLGRVRVHSGPDVTALSDSMQATAFTLGTDVFFRDGLPDTSRADGQALLAHELAHTAQNSGQVARLWNPFKKSEETKQKEAAAKARKEELVKARAELKAKDKAVRLDAKAVNAKNKQVTAQVGKSYAGKENAHSEKSSEHKKLETDFALWLEKERQARAEIRQRITSGVATPEQEEEAELAEERAADLVWQRAPVEIRAFRPLRFDDFDKALNEVRELRNEGLSADSGEAALLLQENEKAFGAPMDHDKALKKVQEQRAQNRRQVRAAQSRGEDPNDAKEMDTAIASGKSAGKLSELSEKRTVGKGEQARIKVDTERKLKDEKYDTNEDLGTATTAFKYAGTGGKLGGSGTKGGTKGVVKEGLFGATEGQGSQIGDLVGTSTTGLGQVLGFISDVLSFASLLSDIKKGIADPDAKLQATQKAVKSVSDAAGVTRTGLMAARDGVSHFGGASEVISQTGQALPIVGLVMSVLAIIDSSLDLGPQALRLGRGLVSVDEAVLARKGPLAASLDRVNSRNVQLVEASTFDIAKNCTMLGLHIAEIASAGGFGIPALAKVTLSVTGMAHSLGHKIYDTVSESKSATAKKNFGVKHQEGASRDVVRYDVGTSVDILIVAAQKHKVPYAKKILMDYGVTATEVESMRMHELREKILDGLDATGDPKTVSEKIQDAKDKVGSVFGVEKKPAGMKGEEKSTWEKVKAAPGDAGKALKALPGKIGKAIGDIKQKHAEGKELIASKNALNYGGVSNRGRGAALAHMFRGGDAVEKSFGKVRHDMAAEGVTPGSLPYTASHRKQREEVNAQKFGSSKKEKVNQVDPAFIQRVTKATAPELYGILDGLDKNDPANLANLEFLEWEVARRMQGAGATMVSP